MIDTVDVTPTALAAAVVRIFQAVGSPADEANTVANHLVEANLKGHHSHGVAMIPTYLDDIARGVLSPGQSLKVITDRACVRRIDSRGAFGQVTGLHAAHWAAQAAKTHGIAAVAVHRAHHIGRLGAYLEAIIEHQVAAIGFASVASHAIVVPHGGRQARLGTNPIGIALPATGAPQLVLDMATSHVAMGKMRVAMNKGLQVPLGLLVDAEGEQTTDPTVLFTEPVGALLPTGAHKGYGLAFMIEAVAALLTGGDTIAADDHDRDGLVNHMVLIAIDPHAFGPASPQSLADLERWVRSATATEAGGRVLLPGEPETLAAAAQREHITLDAGTVASIREAAGRVMADLPFPFAG